jgi:hypothetical protein
LCAQSGSICVSYEQRGKEISDLQNEVGREQNENGQLKTNDEQQREIGRLQPEPKGMATKQALWIEGSTAERSRAEDKVRHPMSH